MNHVTSVYTLPFLLLNKLIFEYTHHTKALIPGERPDLVDVLSGYDYEKSADEQREMVIAALNKALLDEVFFKSKEEEFLRIHAANGLKLQTMAEYANETFLAASTLIARENVRERYEAYKADVLSKDKEHIWNEAYYANIAQQIMYFFEKLDEIVGSGILSSDGYVLVLSCALSKSFFDNLFDIARQKLNFDVSDMRSTASEIVGVCECIEISPEAFDEFAKELNAEGGLL